MNKPPRMRTATYEYRLHYTLKRRLRLGAGSVGWKNTCQYDVTYRPAFGKQFSVAI